MPDSNTSSEINVNLYDNNGKIDTKSENKKSSDTDYYFNMIANQNKTVADKPESSSSSSRKRSKDALSMVNENGGNIIHINFIGATLQLCMS
jgi:hypothetical protein